MDFRHPREVLAIDQREVSQSGIERKKDDDEDAAHDDGDDLNIYNGNDEDENDDGHET